MSKEIRNTLAGCWRLVFLHKLNDRKAPWAAAMRNEMDNQLRVIGCKLSDELKFNDRNLEGKLHEAGKFSCFLQSGR